jgi:hypothetical protein
VTKNVQGMKVQTIIVGLVGIVIGFAVTRIIDRRHPTVIDRAPRPVSTTDNLAPSKWKWPDSLDAVKAAPESHRVLFENDKLRILEVTIEPYGFEPMHTHRFPSVMFGSGYDSSHFNIVYYRYDYDSARHIYFIKDSIRQHSGGVTGESNRGDHMMPEGPHRIKNLSNVRIDAFRVEFKQDMK